MIIDDGQARKTAKLMGLTITGTIGILLRAGADEKINFKESLDLLILSGFRLAKKEYDRVLKISEEI